MMLTDETVERAWHAVSTSALSLLHIEVAVSMRGVSPWGPCPPRGPPLLCRLPLLSRSLLQVQFYTEQQALCHHRDCTCGRFESFKTVLYSVDTQAQNQGEVVSNTFWNSLGSLLKIQVGWGWGWALPGDRGPREDLL